MESSIQPLKILQPLKIFGLELSLSKHFVEQSESRMLLGGNHEYWPNALAAILESSTQFKKINPPSDDRNELFFIWDNQWQIVTVKTKKCLIAITAYPFKCFKGHKYIESDTPLK